jgi:excisionase family DNA binding protein
MKGEKVVSLAGWRDKLLLSVEEVAVVLDMSVRTIWRLCGCGELAQPVKVRGASRFKVSDIEAYVERITSVRDRQAGGVK